MIAKIKKDLIIEKIDNKIVIFDSKQLILFSFNETGSYIIKKIKSGDSTDKIIKGMVKKYRIKKDLAKRDLDEFLSSLLKKRLVFLSKRKK